MPLIYITGPSGAGKSTLALKLREEGFITYDGDEELCKWIIGVIGEEAEYPKDPEKRSSDWQNHHKFLMSEEMIKAIAEEPDDKTIFILGHSPNDLELADKYFDKVICLEISENTMIERVTSRTNNEYGHSPDQQAIMRKWFKPTLDRYRNYGAEMIDAEQDVDKVIKAVIRFSKNNFDDWLKAKHSKISTPSELVDTYVQKAVGSPVSKASRIVIGQINEVYDVTTLDNRSFIVRISRQDDPRFEAERWALDACRKVGVPTPKVLLVAKALVNNDSITFCIEEKLPGRPLDELFKDTKSKAELDSIIKQIGKVLSRIHEVKIDGFGYLQPDGTDWDIPFSKIMLDLIEKEDELLKVFDKFRIPQSKVKESLALLVENTDLYKYETPSLVHGDFGPPHILVNDGSITGIIDMQDCSGNHPVFDFVHWETTYGRDIPLQKLIDSYSNKTLFDESFDPLFNLVLLRHCMWMLIVRVEQDNPHDIDNLSRGIDRALKFLSNRN